MLSFISTILIILTIYFNIKKLKTSKSEFIHYYENIHKIPFLGSILSIYILLLVCIAVISTCIYFIVESSINLKKYDLEDEEIKRARQRQNNKDNDNDKIN